MMADNTADPTKRPKMTQVFWKVVKNDGILGLYRGTMPAASRACVGAMSELAIYDDVKQGVLNTYSQRAQDLLLKFMYLLLWLQELSAAGA